MVLEVAPPYWQSPEGLNKIYLHTAGKGVVPLSTVSTAQATTTPLVINHTSSFPSVTVSFNLANDMSLSDATREVGQMQQQMGMPPTVRGFFAGTAAAYQTSLASEPVLVITALLAVYIVLGILYENLVHPVICPGWEEEWVCSICGKWGQRCQFLEPGRLSGIWA